MSRVDVAFRKAALTIVKFVAPVWEIFAIGWIVIAIQQGNDFRTIAITAATIQVPILIPLFVTMIGWGIAKYFRY